MASLVAEGNVSVILLPLKKVKLFSGSNTQAKISLINFNKMWYYTSTFLFLNTCRFFYLFSNIDTILFFTIFFSITLFSLYFHTHRIVAVLSLPSLIIF